MTQSLDVKYSLVVIIILNNLDKYLKANPRCLTKYLIEEAFGIGCWLLDTVRRQGGWRLGAGMFPVGGGRW